MNCDRAQAVLSSRLDGDRAPDRVGAAVDEHMATCPRCRAFEANALRLRTSVRVVPAEPVPDLVGSIMARVSLEARPRRRWQIPAPGRPRSSGNRRLTPVLAAAIAGLMAGSVVVGGPWQRPTTRLIAAAAVVMGVQETAPSLDAFAATFAVTEHGLSPEVPERRLRMDVAFLAPQRFRLDVHDETIYPSTRWTPTDLTFIDDGSSTYRSGATGCPADLPAGGCPPTRTAITTHRAYSVQAPVPADLVLPLTTFSSADGIEVLGTDRVAGRDAIRVRLTFARAKALFPFLELGGTWRPFFDDDRVDLWLDATDWFPLRYTVYPSTDPARGAWELRFGLHEEPTDEPIFDVRLTSFERDAPDPARFDVPGFSRVPEVPLASFPRRVGYLPVTPTSPGELRLSSAVVPPGDVPDAPRSVLLYTDGMAYVRIGERPDWAGTTLFGPVDEGAQQVELAGGGVAYYEPAGEGLGRRLAIHASGTNVFLESNLPRAQLLALAASLPVRGETLPDAWRTLTGSGISIEQIVPTEALARSPIALELPATLPAGYVLASAQVASDATSIESDVIAVSFVFRQRETDTAGGPIVLHVQPGAALPSASSALQVLVDLDGVAARWTPSRGQLEWIAGGAYLSLEGGLDLAAMLELASQVRPVDGAASP
ncbi:MAG: zf-HC2 domain-containing protein [Actinomycetota bacterium]